MAGASNLLVKGPAGRAWTREIDAAIFPTGVVQWIVEVPKLHPMWDQWIVTCVHLRELEGFPAPVLYGPDVTHEIVVAAIEPGCRHSPEVENRLPHPAWLRPVDQIVQFEAKDDDEARQTVSRTIDAIVEGRLPPDSAFRNAWARRFPANPYRGAYDQRS